MHKSMIVTNKGYNFYSEIAFAFTGGRTNVFFELN